MREKTLKASLGLCAISVAMCGCMGCCSSGRATTRTAIDGPALPLPEISHDELALPGYPPDRPIANSIRAWHYNAKMVPLLSELGDAVADEVSFSKAMMLKLVAVVASRNGCRY